MVMAIIYTKCGESEKAMDDLEDLLAQETGYSVNDFKLNVHLKPLWGLPRFQDMMQRYAFTVGPS